MIEAWLETAVGVVWNYPVVGLCLFSGVFFTLRLAFVQLRCLPHALALISGKYDNPEEEGHITHFQALSAALSGTIGLGNIAGVAIAIAMGGPGAVFWMWIIAFFGMATKYAECALGTLYREKDPITGKLHGGPMHYITKGLGEKWRPVAIFFAICCAIGSLGFANMFQANQVSYALDRYYHIPDWVTGIVLAMLVGLTILGGIKRIGKVASKIVPTMCGIYLLSALYICLINIELIPYAHMTILRDAFSGQAATGGVIGTVILIGVRRAVFSNEAGLGSAPIAHAAVKTNYPIREGVVASLGPLIDTIVVCTATAMVIILSGNYGTERYEATASTPVTTEKNSDYLMTGGWTLKGDNVPVDTDLLRDFHEGDHALSYTSSRLGGSVLAPAITLTKRGKNGLSKGSLKENGTPVSDGMRFSCYHEGTEGHTVQVLDNKGGVISHLAVNEKGAEAELMSITPCVGNGTWHSHVVSFTPAFIESVKEDPAVYGAARLRFSAEAESGSWYVDRLQAVRSLTGIALTTSAFDSFMTGWAGILMSVGVVFFCYSTMITWSYYGQTSLQFVFGERIVMPFKLLFTVVTFFGCVVKLSVILNFADLMTGLMVIPNTIAILMLSPVVVKETKRYFASLKAGEFEPTQSVSSAQVSKSEV